MQILRTFSPVRPAATSRRASQRGVSLVEQAAVLCIVACTVGAGVPSLEKARQSRQLGAAASELRTDLHYARASAVAMGQTVHLRTNDAGPGSCYVIYAGPRNACSCSADGAPQCSADAQLLRASTFVAQAPVTLSSNSDHMSFDPALGTVTPTGTFTLRNKVGDTLKVVINIMGRVRDCRDGGELPSYARC